MWVIEQLRSQTREDEPDVSFRFVEAEYIYIFRTSNFNVVEGFRFLEDEHTFGTSDSNVVGEEDATMGLGFQHWAKTCSNKINNIINEICIY